MGGPVQSSIQYVLELVKFSAYKIRSGDKDTDVVAFKASVGQPPPALVYPTQTKRMENILEGDHYLAMYIGPILAPIDTPVIFTFTIVNAGYGASESNEILQVVNALSDFCDAVCQALLKSAVWDTFNNDTKLLNALILANCDGPVAADGQWIAVDVLQEWTSNGPYVRTTGPYIGTLPPQKTVVCHPDSNYTVTWSVLPKTDALGLLGMSSDGRVWYATLENDGGWIPFSQLQPPSGSPLVAISHAGSVNDRWHICGITSDGGIWHTTSMGEQWQDVRKATSFLGGFGPVSVTTVFGELHICGITPYDWNVWHTIRHTDGSWQAPFSLVKSLTSDPGSFTDVGCAGVAGELHLCGVTKDGGLWHTIRHMDGSWQAPFGDVKGQAGNPGTFTKVSCAGVADELHLCGVTADGGLWHTIRHKDGTWAPFFDVKNRAGNPVSPAESPSAFVDCSSAGVNGDLHLCGIISDGNLLHTIRHTGWAPGGEWEFFENVTGQAGGQGPFSVVSATQLLWTWFPPQPPQVTIQGSETISVTLADLDPANPVLEEGPYSVNPVGLQAPLKIQWRGELGATILDDRASSTYIDFDMTGQILPQGHKEFVVSVSVTDRLGVSVSAQARIFIRVIDRGKGGG